MAAMEMWSLSFSRGVKLNYPEAIALITEAARL